MTTSTLSRIGIPTGTWKVDTAHTRVGFAVKSLGIATVRGEFREFDGALEIGEDLADSRAYGRVDAASVDTNLARRDKHLRSTDFLSAESHPELTFRSKAIEPVDDDTFRVIGDLSINGVTNEVELIAEPGGIETGRGRGAALPCVDRPGLSHGVRDEVPRRARKRDSRRQGEARHRRRGRQGGLVPMFHPQTEPPRAPAPPRWDDLETFDWRGDDLLRGRTP
jgi:polyisoprenoid-binding protein YceI